MYSFKYTGLQIDPSTSYYIMEQMDVILLMACLSSPGASSFFCGNISFYPTRYKYKMLYF